MSFLVKRRRTQSTEASAGSTWTQAAMGDDTGSIVEQDATTIFITTAGNNDIDNGQFAHQTFSASSDLQVVARVSGGWSGTPENFTSFGVQMREALTSGAKAAQCVWPNIGSVRGKVRASTSGTIETGNVGISGKSLPQYLALTYDLSENEIAYWESEDASAWFQVASATSMQFEFPVLAGIYGVSHDTFSTISTTLTGCSADTTITISEASAPASAPRTGILQTITLASTGFNAYGGAETVDAFRLITYASGSGELALVDNTNGGTFDSEWDLTRVDINTEEGVSGPVSDSFLRYRLRYNTSYFSINGGGSGPNKPRQNLRWALNGNGGRYEDDREFWLSCTWYFPSDYEIDTASDDNRETLMQFHNASGGSGHGRVTIGGQGVDSGRLNIVVNHSDTTDEANSAGTTKTVEAYYDMNDLIGEFFTVVWNARFNPFSTQTTVDSSMGRNPQVGETFQGNKGKFHVWATVPNGVTVESNSMGTITNSSATQMKQICNITSAPVGMVPSWRAGVSGQNPMDTSFYLYKPRWMDQIDFASRPSIPHDHSTKSGPIVVYLGQCRFGDESSDYQSVHPEQEAQPS